MHGLVLKLIVVLEQHSELLVVMNQLRILITRNLLLHLVLNVVMHIKLDNGFIRLLDYPIVTNTKIL